MSFRKRNDDAEEKITVMKEIIKSGKFEKSYIRELVAKQKGELSVASRYYKGNIAEANWSLLEKDSDIENLDKETTDAKIVNAEDVLLGLDEYPRKEDAEYKYVFIPSYYAVKTLILYYMEDKKQAKEIYSLKNAVVRREGEEFYGGLPFILKYMRKLSKDDSVKDDFAKNKKKLIDCKSGLESNHEKDDFINDIIDCIKHSY